MKEKKICGICHKEIVIPGEEYCILSQYNREGKFYKDGYYHVLCYSQKFLMNNQANEMMSRTMKILEKAEEKFA